MRHIVILLLAMSIALLPATAFADSEENGGFILSSPGCSSAPWNAAFHREIALALPGYELKEIPMDHEIFSTVHMIKTLTVRAPRRTDRRAR